MPESSYIGSELEIFQHAVNWKKYFGELIQQYLGSEVLEVGAGIAATTELLLTSDQKRWVCLEPDSSLVDEIVKKIFAGILPPACEPLVGDISCLADDELFDSVIYIDVLEHIEDDKSEAAAAAKHLKPGGHLIVLSPAHQFLFTSFDKAIGHIRRYSIKSLSSVVHGSGLVPVRSIYLDSIGSLASLANKLLLHNPLPSVKQIIFWDRFLIPASRIADPIFFYKIGKSIIGIWQKSDDQTVFSD